MTKRRVTTWRIDLIAEAHRLRRILDGIYDLVGEDKRHGVQLAKLFCCWRCSFNNHVPLDAR